MPFDFHILCKILPRDLPISLLFLQLNFLHLPHQVCPLLQVEICVPIKFFSKYLYIFQFKMNKKQEKYNQVKLKTIIGKEQILLIKFIIKITELIFYFISCLKRFYFCTFWGSTIWFYFWFYIRQSWHKT